MEQQLGILTLQGISLNRELSSLGQAININALKNWESKLDEYLADLKAGIHEKKMPFLKVTRNGGKFFTQETDDRYLGRTSNYRQKS